MNPEEELGEVEINQNVEVTFLRVKGGEIIGEATKLAE